MTVYVGMDVAAQALPGRGGRRGRHQQRNRNVANDPAKLIPILGPLPPGTPVAFEAADGWGWLVELLEELEPHLVHPSRCKAIAAARLQERQGGCGHPGPAAPGGSAARGLDRTQPVRDLGVRLRTGPPWSGCRPPARTGFTPSSLTVAGLAGRSRAASDPRAIIEDCCGLLDALAAPIGRLEREITTLAKPDPRVQALMVLPGVGRLTAMTLVAEIGDIARFPTAPKLCAWAGLTPQVRTSDRKVRHGHITNQGSPWVRWILQEAAHTAKRSPQFAAHLRPAGSPPGQADRHHRDRPAAAGPLLPHPQGGPDRRHHGRRPHRAGSWFRLSRQHGR
jgi:transposase